MKEKILVIGAGFLGSHIQLIGKKMALDITKTNFSKEGKKLDVRDVNSIRNIFSEIKPNLVYNCAAITNVDNIETDSKNAYDVNALGAKNVAIVSAEKDIKLIHISTDSVFDGNEGQPYKENDLPNPINQYAKSKRDGEKFVINTHPNTIVVRTNFYGYENNEKFLFNWILNNLKNKKTITAFEDIVFNPLEINNLAEILLELGKINYNGFLHLSSDDIMSKYQFAEKIAKILNFDLNLIKKGSSENANFIAKRPKNTCLDNSLAKSMIKTKFKLLNEWLEEKSILFKE